MKITKAYIRTYGDTGQVKIYVEWSDGSRTEGCPRNMHMIELLARAKREGVTVSSEIW